MHKKGASPRTLKPKNFVYDLIEDTQRKKKPDLRVVLTAYIDGLGNRGDVVSVRPNIAYNRLLLPGLAVYETPENIAKYQTDQIDENVEKFSSKYAQRTKTVLENRLLNVVMNIAHPWVVEPWHIRVSLRKCGIYVADDSCIELPKEQITGPDLSINNKEFFTTVTINDMEKAKVRCRIYHWSTDPTGRLPYVVEHWMQPAEPLFPDDETQCIPWVEPKKFEKKKNIFTKK